MLRSSIYRLSTLIIKRRLIYWILIILVKSSIITIRCSPLHFTCPRPFPYLLNRAINSFSFPYTTIYSLFVLLLSSIRYIYIYFFLFFYFWSTYWEREKERERKREWESEREKERERERKREKHSPPRNTFYLQNRIDNQPWASSDPNSNPRSSFISFRKSIDPRMDGSIIT